MRNLLEYRVAGSVDEALEFVQGYAGRAAFLAGGTHLGRLSDPALQAVADLSRLGLDRVERIEGVLRLGATIPLERLRQDPQVAELGDGLLELALTLTRMPAWRQQATLGGRLREADPADLVTTVLLVMDAEVELQRAPRTRPVQLPLSLALEEDPTHLILAVRIPTRIGWRFALEALSLTRLDVPVAAVAVGAHIQKHRLHEARVAACGLAPRPRRLPQVESGLLGLLEGGESFEAAARRLVAAIAPADDIRASREYREHLGQVLLARALCRVLGKTPETSPAPQRRDGASRA